MNAFRLDGKRALVTGSSRGLGLSIAASMAEAGAAVVLHGRDAEALAAAADRLRSEGRTVETAAGDLSEPASVREVAAAALSGGPIDILVNNAGFNIRKEMAELTDDEWNSIVEVDLSACFRLSRALAPAMVQRGFGRIINIGSIMSVIARARIPAYAAVKHGLAGLTKALAVELGPQGVTVNAIGPGFCKSEGSLPNMQDKATSDMFLRRTPLARMGEPEEIGWPAVFLASPAAAYVNGHLLVVDGGLTISL